MQTCRRELLDHTLIWNQRHLLHALREFETFYNQHRPHQGIANARPLKPLPPPITEPERLPERPKTATSGRDPQRVRTCRLLHRRGFRQGQGWTCWSGADPYPRPRASDGPRPCPAGPSRQNVLTTPRGASGGHCAIARRTRGSTGSKRAMPQTSRRSVTT
ncbi:hypothetical protein [Actinomadura sp. NTSP31]|uniref:hypothetical protein n=1 Tax=Actinomadura sp. NTSP31 TaxID=1735447 RepID=UPI0035C0E173